MSCERATEENLGTRRIRTQQFLRIISYNTIWAAVTSDASMQIEGKAIMSARAPMTTARKTPHVQQHVLRLRA